MPLTWAQFRAGVLTAYNNGAAMDKLVYAAVAAYVKSLICREVDSDLPLAKSYMNDYLEYKRKLAGVAITANFATVKSAVQTRITVDANRTAIGSYIDAAIQEAMDDLNAMQAVWEKYLIEAAIGIQRHVEFFQQNNQDSYLMADVEDNGFCSKLITPPSTQLIHEVYYQKYAPALAEGVLYAATDRVVSNARIYEVVTGGTLTSGQLGGGLTSVDGTDETLGSLVFRFVERLWTIPAVALDWKDRDQLVTRTVPGNGPYFVLSPFGELWTYPRLDSDEVSILVFWNGVKQTFADGDTVTLDERCFNCAAEFVRYMIYKNTSENDREAGAAYVSYTNFLRGLWIDKNVFVNSAL
jgi:hypothetical protein